ncbi:MAG: hypothetical protein AB1847_12110 [bacterium]
MKKQYRSIILTALKFFFWRTEAKVRSRHMSMDSTLETLRQTGGFTSGLNIHVIRPYRVIVNSMRHYGRRGTPIIPYFYAELRREQEGIVLHGTLTLTFSGRFFLFLFPVAVTVPLLCSWSKVDFRILGAVTLFFSLYIPLLAAVFIIGQQDIRHILSTLEARLQSEPDHPQRAKKRKRRK